ncbi:MAG: hypothetical protein ACE361_19105 [Aureliella sp.]
MASSNSTNLKLHTKQTNDVPRRKSPAITSLETSSIHPITAERLSEYADRRRQLAIFRGICVSVSASALLLVVATLVDASWISSSGTGDAARGWASFAFYVPAIGILIWQVALPWVRPLDFREEADVVGRRVPPLSELLPTAIELGSQQPTDGSAEFTEAIQAQTANQMESLDVFQLLPLRRIRIWVRVALASACCLILLGLLPGVYFFHRSSRVLFPLANLGRVSLTRIEITRPLPQNKTVARGDTILIEARVTGRITGETATLEIERGSVESSTILLTPASNTPSRAAEHSPSRSGSRAKTLSCTLQVEQPRLRYRARIGTATTPWYTLESVARPEVSEFITSVRLPEYAGAQELPPQQGNHRNTRVLKGSWLSIDLKVEPCQSRTKLLRDQDFGDAADEMTSDPVEIELKRNLDSGRHHFEQLVENSFNYRVRITDLTHGFSNAFAPSYRVEAVQDAPPVVQGIAPREPYAIVSPNTLVDFSYRITDELPVQRVDFLASTNGSDWQAVFQDTVNSPSNHPIALKETLPPFSDLILRQVAESKSIEHTPSFRLDLLQLSAVDRPFQPGDKIRVKVRATDLAGNVAESKETQLAVSSIQLQLAETSLESRRVKAASLLRSVTEALPPGSQIEELSNAELRGLSSDTAKRLDAIRPKLTTELQLALQSNLDPSIALELIHLELATRELSLDLSSNLQTEERTSDSGGLRTTLNRLRLLTDAANHFVAHDSALRHVRELQSLLAAYGELASPQDGSVTSTNTDVFEQSKRELSVLNRQLLQLAQGILDSIAGLDETRQKNRRNSANRLQTIATHSEDRSARSNSANFSQQLDKTIQELSQASKLASVDAGIDDASASSLRTLRDLVPPAERIFQPVLGSTATQGQLSLAAEELTQRRTTLRSDRTAVPGFAADLGQAARALDALSATEDPNQLIPLEPGRVQSVSQAVSVLQLANDIEVANSHLRMMISGETQLDTPNPDLELLQPNPRRWDAYESNLDTIVRNLSAAGLPNEMRKQIQSLRWNPEVAAAKDALVSRRWSDEVYRSARGDLLRLKKQVNAAQSDLQHFVDAARERLFSMGPSIESLARAAAEQARSLGNSTRQAADSRSQSESTGTTSANPLPNVIAENANEFRRSKQLETKSQQATQTLRDALVDLAEAQNFTDSQQVSTALLADAGIQVVDQAQELLRDSALPSAEALPNASASQLNEIAEAQAKAATALETVADIFERNSSTALTGDSSSAEEELQQLAAELQRAEYVNNSNSPEFSTSDLGQRSTNAGQRDSNAGEQVSDRMSPSADRMPQLADRAKRLASLAEADPSQLLAELESRLAQSTPMQSELSSIARQATNEALKRIEQAALEQARLTTQIETSDPNVARFRERLVEQIKEARKTSQHIADTLLRELELTTQLSKSDDVLQSVKVVRQELTAWNQQQKPGLNELSEAELNETKQQTSQQLNNVRVQLDKLKTQLAENVGVGIHQNGAELNNRRRAMRDRSKNLFRKHLNYLQSSESRAKQRLRKTEADLSQSRRQLQAAARNSTAAQKRLEQNDNEANKENVRQLRRKSALIRMEVAAGEQMRGHVADQLQQLGQNITDFKSSPAPELQAENPSAEWAASLSELTSQLADQVVAAFDSASNATPSNPRGEESALQKAIEFETGQQTLVDEAGASLSRAARHEARLEHLANSIALRTLAATVDEVIDDSLVPASDALLSAWESSQEDENLPVASPSITKAALQASSQAHVALSQAGEQIENFLNPSGGSPTSEQALSNSTSTNPPTAPNSSASSKDGRPSSSGLLSPEQMAQLLDELDQQLNATELGAKEDASENPASSSRKSTPASTLAEAARDTAQSMSRARSPENPKANADLGTATDADAAKVAAERPVEVELLGVERIDGDWGKLRDRVNEKVNSSNKTRFAPELQRQVEAYFERIAETEESR